MNEATAELVTDLKLWACSPRVPMKAQLVMLEAIGRLTAPSVIAATPWDKCQFEIVAWEIDQGQIGISVKHEKGGSAWAVVPHEHVQKLLRDGLRYRWWREHWTAESEDKFDRLNDVLKSDDPDQDIDAAMASTDGSTASIEKPAAQPIEWPFRREPMP